MASSGSDRRPVIGLTTYTERARYGVWDHDAVLLPRGYVDAVLRAGGAPVLLPSIGDVDAQLTAAIDALVLTGGADLEPTRYHQTAEPRTVGIRVERDGFEFSAMRAALAAGLPILGICRGMQVLNVALGGTLIQHLPDRVNHAGHRPMPGSFGDRRIRLAASGTLATILGSAALVHCHHHQAVDKLGNGLVVTGWDEDNTVEAVELPGHDFVLGVQWHPEEDAKTASNTDNPGDRIFSALVRAAKRGVQ